MSFLGDLLNIYGSQNYNPLGFFLDSLDTAGKGGTPGSGKGETTIGPIHINMDGGKPTGAYIPLGGDMTINRKADGNWDLNNGKSGIRYNAKTGRFEYYNRGLTVGYGGPDNWQVSEDGPTSWQVGSDLVKVSRDGREIGYSPKSHEWQVKTGSSQGSNQSGDSGTGGKGPTNVSAGPGAFQTIPGNMWPAFKLNRGPYVPYVFSTRDF